MSAAERVTYCHRKGCPGHVPAPVPRYASPQAWRRVRAAVGPGESVDLARDIVGHAVRVSPTVAALGMTSADRAAFADAVAHALTVAEWDGPGYRQQ